MSEDGYCTKQIQIETAKKVFMQKKNCL